MEILEIKNSGEPCDYAKQTLITQTRRKYIDNVKPLVTLG